MSKGKLLLKAVALLAAVGMLIAGGLMLMVSWKEHHVPPAEDYDAIIVLGAQVRDNGKLSVQLQWRLDAALEAYRARECIIIPCGAQGADEPMPEAVAMRDYLTENGVPPDKIAIDAESVNTRENLRNAAVILRERGMDNARVAIVTSDYHLPRAMALAEDEGLTATGIGAPTKPEYWLKNHLREGLSWVKYWGQKYLHLSL